MSAGIVWVPGPARMPSRDLRPRLRLVGPVECGDRGCGPASPATRVTRRGRLVIMLTVTALVVALAVMLAGSVDAAGPRIDHATAVLSGQTLSEVAAAQLPGLPIHEGVARIQLANGLNTFEVRAGQLLLIPEMR